MKIVSLVPSFTELLIDLGLEKELVGRTRFCERPADKIEAIKIIGGTKNPDIRKIIALEPDFILANKEENRKEDIDALRKFSHVHVTDIKTVDDALKAIWEIGNLLNCEDNAQEIVNNVRMEMERIPDVHPVSTAYFIWRNPWMSIGGDTYISDIMRLWGLYNVCASELRYPVLEPQRLARINPKYILLSSEPFPFNETHKDEIKALCPDSTIVLVDGQWFSWYGSRMIEAFRNLNEWRVKLRVM